MSINEAVCRGIQTHFGSSPLASLREKALATISRILRPKTKLFAVKFRCISKVSACKVYRKSCGCNFTMCVSKNEVVCCEVQTHFGSFRLSSFMKKVVGAFS